MSKKTATIIIVILVLLLAGGLLAFYFYSNQGQGNNIAGTTPRGNIFPTTSGSGGTQNPTTTTSGTSGQPTTSGTQAAPVLKELSIRPSAGAVAIATTSTPSVLVHFIERGTGNVYGVSPQSDTETRLSDTTIPKIEEALWDKTGTKVIARYAGDDGDSIKTYSASLTSQSTSTNQTIGSLQGSFLTDNISAIVANPDQNSLFYLLPNSAGSTGIISGFDGSKKNQVFDSLLKDFLVDWPTPTLVALTTKPSAGVPGLLFLLNTKTGGLIQAIAGVNGLTASVNPTGSLALYGESVAQGIALKIYSFKDGSTEETSVSTLPEKCVWSKIDPTILYCSVPSYLPAANYPDDWYKGTVSFSDDIWKIDSATGAGQILVTLKNYAKQDIDGTNLFLSPKEDYLFFTNKNDFHLWSLRLLSK